MIVNKNCKPWQRSPSEQRSRYNNLITSSPTIDWTYKEKECLLWLCQLDIDTFETFEVVLNKIKHINDKRVNL
ncbi:hypothetical protein [Enterococcus gallinarum]